MTRHVLYWSAMTCWFIIRRNTHRLVKTQRFCSLTVLPVDFFAIIYEQWQLLRLGSVLTAGLTATFRTPAKFISQWLPLNCNITQNSLALTRRVSIAYSRILSMISYSSVGYIPFCPPSPLSIRHLLCLFFTPSPIQLGGLRSGECCKLLIAGCVLGSDSWGWGVELRAWVRPG